MKVSLVVPAFNEEKLLGGTLAALRAAATAFTAKGWDWEIIVCDNNSTDQTSAIARAAGATVIFEPVNQIARARNTGASVATGDWLIFVDADSSPSLELLDEVAREISRGRCLAGGCTVSLDKAGFAARCIVAPWNFVSRLGTWLAGSFIFVETRAFRQVGGFSAELFAAEELELTQRLKRLARAENRRLIVLHRFPLLTSARKLSLYRPGELFGFFFRVILLRRRVLGSRESAYLWYDGRR